MGGAFAEPITLRASVAIASFRSTHSKFERPSKIPAKSMIQATPYVRGCHALRHDGWGDVTWPTSWMA